MERTGPTGADLELDDFLGELDWEIKHLQVTDQLFEKLPPALLKIRDDYRPSGPATVTHTFRALPTGGSSAKIQRRHGVTPGRMVCVTP